LFKARNMLEERPSLHALETIVRRQLASYFAPDEIDSILAEAEADNPAAEFVIASALESGGKHQEAMKWFRRSADQGYHPALERLRRNPPHAA
jgi:TPR repeat protein